MSDKPVSVLLVGINGYAKGYLDLMLKHANEHGAVIEGIADPTADSSDLIGEIRERKIPVYATMEEFYASHKADLAVISTPIQLHCQHLKAALDNGSNVLCEKPLCSTADEAALMQQAAAASDKFTAIGYNWSFSSTIQEMKKDILSGMYGKAKRMKCVVFWPRPISYYNRCNWAGKQKNPAGDWVLDSPLSNATSHFLHNMLYVCGETVQQAAQPASVCAELYRANDIENFDTAMVRVQTTGGTEIMFYTSHAINVSMNPLSFYEFENGTISHTAYNTNYTGVLKDGTVKQYEMDPCLNAHDNKLWQCIDHCRDGGKPVCNVETATALTQVVNAAQLSRPDIIPFPQEAIRQEERGDTQLVYVDELWQQMFHCYDTWKLPSETGMFPWAGAGKAIDAQAITSFSL